MEGRDDVLFAVSHQDRNAIGSLDGEQQARFGRDQAVSFTRHGRKPLAGNLDFKRPFGLSRGSSNNKVRVKLAQGNQLCCWIAANGLCQEATVRDYDVAVIVSGKSEIQFTRSILCTIRPA